jgi:hypothetical protein
MQYGLSRVCTRTVGFGYVTIKAMYLYQQKGYPVMRGGVPPQGAPISVGKPWPHPGIALPSAHTYSSLPCGTPWHAFLHILSAPPVTSGSQTLAFQPALFSSLILLTLSDSLSPCFSFKVAGAGCSLRIFIRPCHLDHIFDNILIH